MESSVNGSCLQPLDLFSRAILRGELSAEEVVELAALCEEDPWIDTDRESLEVRRVFTWVMLDYVLRALYAPPERQAGLYGEPEVLAAWHLRA